MLIMNSTKSTKPKIIDLYAGVGGISLGAIRAGFDLALAVEWDKHAMKAHRVNFPSYEHLEEDISGLTGAELLKQAKLEIGELDGLVGGPPCQGFSTIGSRDVLDPRNDLFVKFFKLVKETKPKFFVAENVLGILNSQYDEIRKTALNLVNKEYNVLEPMRLKASDFGAPTSRERVFFIGYRKDLSLNLSAADFEKKKVQEITTVAKALRGLPKQIREDWITEEQSWRKVTPIDNEYFKKYVDGNIPVGMGDAEAVRKYKEEGLISGCFGTRHSKKVANRYQKLKPGETDKISRSIRLKSTGLCPTLRAGTASDKGSYQAVRPIHPTSNRVITPREAARLQGFPDWFQFAPSKWHSFRQIGNSVSPILAEKVLEVIAVSMLKSKSQN